ncbi:exostosin-like protein [Fusarium bulbicola]|nr:exostosin-like protein [Fusarium bulbicola]
MPNSNRQSSEMTPMPIYDSSEQSPSSRNVAYCLQKKWSLLIASIASFIACMVFASMYGFEYSTLSGNDNARNDWSSLREYSSFHEAKNTCGAKDEVANMTIWNAAVEKAGNLLDDMFTITVQAYRRDQLKYTLDHLTAYNTSSLYEIVVFWNDNKSPPPKDFAGNNYVPGILLCDDDWNFNHTDIDWAFHQWRRSGMSRLTGPFAGCWYNNEHDEAMYSLCSERPNKYHMALTALAFTHLSFLEYYWSNDSLMESLREYVDSKSNCEDIALNYVAKS